MDFKKNNIEDSAISQLEQESLELRIAKAVSLTKRTSERIVGLTSIDYSFDSIRYFGTTIRPVSITPLERAIVGIINIDESGSLSSIGHILGLDVDHDIAEQAMLLESINKMKEYGVLEGDETYLTLTEKGKVFANKGERPETYSKEFNIFYDSNHPSYKFLNADFAKAEVKKCLEPAKDQSLEIELIRDLAEVQAPSVQSEKNRYILQTASFLQAEKKLIRIHIAFLQSIRNEEDIRAIAYEETQASLLPHFSDLINEDSEMFKELLASCIAKSLEKDVEDGGWELVSNNLEKDSEQKALEAEVVQREDDEAEGKQVESDNELERLHKKALYDQTSFELELENIFTKDKPDEVWLVSPWVKRVFVQKRVPQFIPLLNAGKRIFIAYSQAEFDSKGKLGEMVTPQAEAEIKKLNDKYPNFYYVELPPFHTKHVIEVKNGQSVLFNGSFNVLSFDALKTEGKIRREEMALVHHQVASSKHQEYVDLFCDIYIQRELEYIRTIDSLKLSSYDRSRMDYLMSIASNKESFVDFFTELDEKQLAALNTIWYEQYDSVNEQLQKLIEQNVVEVNEFKKLNTTISTLIKQCVSLTISEDVVSNLNVLYDRLNSLPRVKAGKKEKNKADMKSISNASTLKEKAEIIVDGADFDTEESIKLFVASIYYLYINRHFDPINKAFKTLRKMLKNKNAMDKVSEFSFATNNRNSNLLDITIIIGGLSFRFFSIVAENVKNKLEKLTKTPAKSKKFKIIGSRNIEETLKKLIGD